MLPEIDIIMGGFPCQDISCAGNGVGLGGSRSGLFFEIMRLAEEIQPTFIFLENVPAIRTRGLDVVGRELADRGYDSRWCALSAQEIGANHKRNRWFCLASNSMRQPEWFQQKPWSKCKSKTEPSYNGETQSLADADGIGGCEGQSESMLWQGRHGPDRGSEHVADADGIGLSDATDEHPETRSESRAVVRSCIAGESWWAVEPDVGRVVNGLPHRVDRIRCLGNSVVPFQAAEAFKRLMGVRIG